MTLYVAGHLFGSPFEGFAMAYQNATSDLPILVDNPSSKHLQSRTGKTCSYTMPSTSQFPVCLHRRHEHLHVYLWSDQILLSPPDGRWSANNLHCGRPPNHPLQHSRRERCCNMGIVWQQVSFLRCQQRT